MARFVKYLATFIAGGICGGLLIAVAFDLQRTPQEIALTIGQEHFDDFNLAPRAVIVHEDESDRCTVEYPNDATVIVVSQNLKDCNANSESCFFKMKMVNINGIVSSDMTNADLDGPHILKCLISASVSTMVPQPFSDSLIMLAGPMYIRWLYNWIISPA